MKEFGKIIKSSFNLKYYDDLALRQSIEKMLSRIELMNRLAKAVFFSNKQEFKVATKEEQEKIIQCTANCFQSSLSRCLDSSFAYFKIINIGYDLACPTFFEAFQSLLP